jgi:nucleoside-diphosphate-sugar epimerase
MRILLTGGAGFISSHVADHLLERGHEVAVVDNLSTGKRGNVPDGAKFYETDVRNGCTRVFEEFAPEALCHEAAQMDVRRSVREPDFDAEVNVLGTVRLLENCTRYGVGKVVFASTGGPYTGSRRRSRLPRTTPSTRSPPTVSRSSQGNATCTSFMSSTVSLTRLCAMPTSTGLARTCTGRRG